MANDQINEKNRNFHEISSNSSMIELKAELLKKKRQFEEDKKNKSAGSLKRSIKQLNEPIKFDPVTNSNVADEDLKRSRDALEAKARLYQRLERGKLAESDLNQSQRENLMVDFAWKGWNPEKNDFDFDFSSDDELDEKDVSKEKLDMDEISKLIETEETDRWIEYEDEFGRTRIAKLSQLRQIQKDREEVSKMCTSSSSHYDGDAEIRNKGVGFYQFSRDAQDRERQMRELKKLREETVEKRMRTLLMKEQRRLRLEIRLNKLKERKNRF